MEHEAFAKPMPGSNSSNGNGSNGNGQPGWLNK
jgi:hypothetical protein